MRTYGKDKVLYRLEDREDLTIKTSIFMCNLYKDFEFSIGDKKYVVTHATKKTLRIKDLTSNINYSFKPEFFEKYGVWLTNTGKGRNDKGLNLLRDIEGILIIEELNKYNIFHKKGNIIKLIETDKLYRC